MYTEKIVLTRTVTVPAQKNWWTSRPAPVHMSWTGRPAPVHMSWTGRPAPVHMSWTGWSVPIIWSLEKHITATK